MTLPAPPALNQMSQPDGDRSEMCGETCAASVLQALGHDVTPEQVIAWMRSVYGESGVSAGTNGTEVIAAFAHWGVPAHAVSGSIATYTEADLASGFYTLCAIYSDSGGNPDPTHRTGHWILNYGPSQYMNPYGGRYVDYPDLTAEDQDYGVVVEVSAVEDDMTYTDQDIQAQVREWYWTYLGRGVESNDAMAYQVNVWKTKGKDACLAEITDSPEGVAFNNAKRKVLGLAPL